MIALGFGLLLVRCVPADFNFVDRDASERRDAASNEGGAIEDGPEEARDAGDMHVTYEAEDDAFCIGLDAAFCDDFEHHDMVNGPSDSGWSVENATGNPFSYDPQHYVSATHSLVFAAGYKAVISHYLGASSKLRFTLSFRLASAAPTYVAGLRCTGAPAGNLTIDLLSDADGKLKVVARNPTRDVIAGPALIGDSAVGGFRKYVVTIDANVVTATDVGNNDATAQLQGTFSNLKCAEPLLRNESATTAPPPAISFDNVSITFQ